MTDVIKTIQEAWKINRAYSANDSTHALSIYLNLVEEYKKVRNAFPGESRLFYIRIVRNKFTHISLLGHKWALEGSYDV